MMNRLLLITLVFRVGLAFAQAPSISTPMKVLASNPDPAAATRLGDSDRILSRLLPEARGKTTLVGGTIRIVDPVRDRLVVRAYGGDDIVILFDSRTRVYRDGAPASLTDLRAGQRIYADTAPAGKDTFARSLQVLTRNPLGQSQGQVENFDPARRELTVRDVSAPGPARFLLAPSAEILRGDRQAASPEELRQGALVSLSFTPSTTGPAVAHEISILAAPGQTFVFSGRVSHLDLSTGLLVLMDSADNKSYEVHFDSAKREAGDGLREGAEVVATTTFDGVRYSATSIVVGSPRDR